MKIIVVNNLTNLLNLRRPFLSWMIERVGSDRLICFYRDGYGLGASKIYLDNSLDSSKFRFDNLSKTECCRAFFGLFGSSSAVWSFSPVGNVLGAILALIFRCRLSVTVTGLGSGVMRSWIVKQLYWCLFEKTIKSAEFVYVTNRSDFRICRSYLGCGSKTNLVLSNGSGLVNWNKISKQWYQSAEINWYVSEWPDSKISKFCYVGRFIEDKNISTLLEIFASEVDENTSMLSMIGAVDVVNPSSLTERDLLPYLARNNIDFAGWTVDVFEVLVRHHCLINLSKREGLSNSVLEAVLLGRYVISTYVPGIKDIFHACSSLIRVDDGLFVFEGAILLHPNKIDRLSDALILATEQIGASDFLEKRAMRSNSILRKYGGPDVFAVYDQSL